MYREIPTANRILSRKWNDYEHQVHMRKLREARAKVTLQAPSKYRHFQVNSKKEQLQEERFTEIERANRILLEKMTLIMNKERLRAASHHPPVTLPPAPKRSLNVSLRKKESERIKLENRVSASQLTQAFLRRLQDRTATYNVLKWEEQSKEREHLLHNMCQYKYVLRDPNRRSYASNLRNRGLSRDQSYDRPRFDRPPLVSQSLDVEHILPPVRQSHHFATEQPNTTVMTDLDAVRPPPLLNESGIDNMQPRIATQGQDKASSLFSPKGEGRASQDPELSRPKGSVSPKHPMAFDFLRKKKTSEKLKPLSLKSLQLFEGPALKRVVLFREEYEISHKNFLIEISRTKKKFFILALDVDLMTTSKQLLVELTERQAKKLMDECGHDYQNVLKRLYLKYDKLLEIKEVNPTTHVLPAGYIGREDIEKLANIDDEDLVNFREKEASRARLQHEDMEMPASPEKRQFLPPQFPQVSHSTGQTESVKALAKRSPSPQSRSQSPVMDASSPPPDDSKPQIG